MNSKTQGKGQIHSKPQEGRKMDFEVRLSEFFEWLSIGFLIFIIVFGVALVPSLKRLLVFFRERNIDPPLEEYWWLLPGFLLSFLMYKFCTTVVIRALIPIINPINYREGESPELRLKRLGTYIYEMIYYSFSFGLLFYFTFGSRYCPKALGGTLDTSQGLYIWPYEVDYRIRIFYMLTLGHHIERALYELTVQFKSKTFYIMTFHHFLTIGLIFLSFFMRHLVYGIPVLLTHDINDIFVYGSRFFRETKNYAPLANVLFALLVVTWFYTRIYSFGYEVLGGIYQNYYQTHYFLDEFYLAHIFFVPALVFLFIINLYWGVQILKVAFVRFVEKKEGLPFEDKKPKAD